VKITTPSGAKNNHFLESNAGHRAGLQPLKNVSVSKTAAYKSVKALSHYIWWNAKAGTLEPIANPPRATGKLIFMFLPRG
jgi:hypothetical protein